MVSSPSVKGNYRFRVEIDNIFVAGFSEVTGIQAEIELEEYREGGENGYVHKFVKGTRHVPLLLKRGLASYELWDWYRQVQEGTVVRRNGAIILIDEHNNDYRRWSFYEAYPVKWVGPELNANASEIAIEQIELIHNGFKFS